MPLWYNLALLTLVAMGLVLGSEALGVGQGGFAVDVVSPIKWVFYSPLYPSAPNVTLHFTTVTERSGATKILAAQSTPLRVTNLAELLATSVSEEDSFHYSNKNPNAHRLTTTFTIPFNGAKVKMPVIALTKPDTVDFPQGSYQTCVLEEEEEDDKILINCY